MAPGIVSFFRCLAKLCPFLGIPLEIVVSVNGTHVAVDLSDIRVTLVYKELTGQTEVAQILPELLTPGDTFLDVGANHGSYSLIARRLVGSDGRVIAFEPQQKLAGLIHRSFVSNGYSNCTVFDRAISDHAGTGRLYLPAAHSGIARFYSAYSALGKHKTAIVPLVSIDQMVPIDALPGKVVLKIDVEGGELSVLHGATYLIERCRPIIVLEVNPDSASAAGYSVRHVFDLLRESNYRFCELEDYPHSVPKERCDEESYRNVLALPQQNMR